MRFGVEVGRDPSAGFSITVGVDINILGRGQLFAVRARSIGIEGLLTVLTMLTACARPFLGRRRGSA